MAPLFAAYDGTEAQAVAWARAMAGLTTSDRGVLAMVDFCASAIHHALAGLDLPTAMARSEKYLTDQTLKTRYASGLASVGGNSTAVINTFGAGCDAFAMFPGVVHLLAKYADQPREAAARAILAGGDNATRCSLVSTILAARHGLDFMPPAWYGAVRRKDHIEALLGKF